MAIKTPDKNKTESIKDDSELLSNETTANRKISIDPNEDVEEDENVQAEFEEEDAATLFAAQPTRENQDKTEIPGNTSAEEVKKQVLEYEESKSGKLEYKDLKQYATVIVTLIDVSFSTLFKLFARDSARSVYELSKPNKEILIEQLTLILAKYQSRFKVEFMFFISLIIMYAPAGVEAFKNRKLTNKALQKKDTKVSIQQKIEDLVSASKPVEKAEEKTTVVEETKVPFVKRNKGRQPKP